MVGGVFVGLMVILEIDINVDHGYINYAMFGIVTFIF